MRCPRCRGRLRPFGHGRTRTVRGLGADTLRVTPRRARCGDCGVTQILLPATLTVRRADSTEVIGAALAAKAGGAGFRAIAAALARPVSTVRSWLRRVPTRTPGGCTSGRSTARCRSTGSCCWSGPAVPAAPDPARARAEPAGRGSAALPRASRADRLAVGVDRLLRPGQVAGPADPLTSGPSGPSPARRRPSSCRAPDPDCGRTTSPWRARRHHTDESRDERPHFQRRLRLQDRRRATPVSGIRTWLACVRACTSGNGGG